MAGGKTHIWGGFVFVIIFIYTITNYFYQPALIEVVIYFALACMFSVWPDIDIKSYGQKFFYIIFFITDLFFIINEEYKIASYFGLIIILPVLAKHRGWTHSIPAMILIPSPLLFYPVVISGEIDVSGIYFYAAAVTGYFSHLVLDRIIGY